MTTKSNTRLTLRAPLSINIAMAIVAVGIVISGVVGTVCYGTSTGENAWSLFPTLLMGFVCLLVATSVVLSYAQKQVDNHLKAPEVNKDQASKDA